MISIEREADIIKIRKRGERITRYPVLPFDMATGILKILP